VIVLSSAKVVTIRTHPGTTLFTNRDAARWAVLLERQYGPPARDGEDLVWANVPEFYEVRVTAHEHRPVTASRQLLLGKAMWDKLKPWPVERDDLGLVIVHAVSLDACATTFDYLETVKRTGENPQQSRLRRLIEGRNLPGWYRRVV